MSHNLFNDNFPDAVFNLWKKEEGKSIASPPSFAMNVFERLGHLNHWTDNPSLLDEATSSIAELDAYQKLLKNHLNSVQEAVDALRGAVRPFMFEKGIDALPDEILSTIFETLESEAEGYDSVTQTCSLVCRRFRRVVLNTPRLWCTISTDMASMDSVIQSLERSKSTGLDIQLVQKGVEDICDISKPDLDFLEVFDSVLAHTERWESFMFDILAASQPLDIREHLKKLTYLPHLKEIYLGYHGEEERLENPTFLGCLRAPLLQRMYFVNCIPGTSALSSTLSSLEIEICNASVDPRLPRRLYSLLKSSPNLEDVSLTLDCCDTQFASDGKFPPFVLQKLKTLYFSVHGDICYRLMSFRKALITPALVDCALYGKSLEDDESVSVVIRFMLCHDEYPTLEALDIEFDSFKDGIAGFEIPFEKVPNLRDLSLDIPGFYMHYDDSERIPALRSLTLRNLGTDAWLWMQRMWSTLREQGDLPGLEEVVIGKRTVSQDWVEKCFEDEILCGLRVPEE